MPDNLPIYSRAAWTIRAVAKTIVFFLKVFPMLPSRPVDWVTSPPVIEKVRYPTCSGEAEGDLYRPSTGGPYPGILVCLGVVPFGVDHPQVAVLGKALARAGFAALLYWSPAMRDFRLDPEDIENIPLAYHWLIDQPYVDPARSGMLGTCVGGSFALMAAAHALVRDHVAFVGAYAPYSSMWTFALDIASSSRVNGAEPEPWKVDPLTRKVFLHSVTATLEPGEADLLRGVFEHAAGDGAGDGEFEQPGGAGLPLEGGLSADGRAVTALLSAQSRDEAQAALDRLPLNMKERLSVMSPLKTLADLHAPLIALLHDRGDLLIPVGESRRLYAALAGNSGVHFTGNTGIRYTEMQFSHLDPVKGKLPFRRLVGEFGKFILAVYPIFRKAAAPA